MHAFIIWTRLLKLSRRYNRKARHVLFTQPSQSNNTPGTNRLWKMNIYTTRFRGKLSRRYNHKARQVFVTLPSQSNQTPGTDKPATYSRTIFISKAKLQMYRGDITKQ